MATETTDKITLHLQVCPRANDAERIARGKQLQKSLSRQRGVRGQPATIATETGDKCGEALDWGNIAVTLGAAALPELIGLLRDWLQRGEDAGEPRALTMIIGDNHYPIDKAMSAEKALEIEMRLREQQGKQG